VEYSLGEHLRELPGPLLLTGHTGFKGTWMTFLFEELKVPVIGFSLSPEKDSLYEKTNRLGVIPEEYGDIRNYDLLKAFIELHKPSTIIHMAAQPLVLKSYENPLATFETNVMGTANILDIAFKSNFVQAVVIVTTDKVYKNSSSGIKFIESDSLLGKDPYSASKVGAESVVSAWQQIAKVFGGPKVVSVRAGNVIGGGDLAKDRLIPDIIRSHISRKPLIVRNQKSTRPWQHVLDPLNGYVSVVESLLQGKLIDNINFGPSEKSLEVAKVVEICSKFIEFDFQIQDLSIALQNIESASLDLDINYAIQILNWRPVYSQDFAIQKTMNWWKNVLEKKEIPSSMCTKDIIEFLNLIKH
jgi:CDP-glucose 4,6-dehydratase